MINKFKTILKISWISTLYFNFHHLPFAQAIKLPVLLYKAKLLGCKGKVIIENSVIRTGMIQMGDYSVSLYPNKGIVWENHGGTVIFKGRCDIGNSSAISIGPNGYCVFGDNFKATTSLKLTSYFHVEFGEKVLIAWDVIVMDSSFHRLKNREGNFKGAGYAPIVIGSYNWITARCMILNGTKTPNYCTVGAGSILNKDYSHFSTHILLAGTPPIIKAENVWIDFDDHHIVDYV